VVTWALGLLALASALLWVFAPQLTELFYGGQGFDAATLALTTDLSRLFLLSPLLLGLGGLAMAALNAHDRFTLPALAPAAYNLGIIGGALFLAPQMGIWGLAWGVVIGALIYLLIQIPGLLRLGMRLHITLGRGVRELGTIMRQMTPRVFGQAAAQTSLLVTAILTAQLAIGDEKLTGLNYAYQLMLLPYGVFSLSLSTVAFPRLARLFAAGKLDDIGHDVRRTLSTIMFLTLPAAAVLIVLAVPLVRVLYQRFAFDELSLAYTYLPLLGYAVALPAFAASEILIRTFYAMQRTWTPVLLGLLQVGLNLGLGIWVLMQGYGVGALALAFSIANTVEALLLALALRWLLPSVWAERQFWRSLFAICASTVLLAVLLRVAWQMSLPYLPYLTTPAPYEWQQDMLPLLLWLVVVGGSGALCYVGCTTVLGAQEARVLLRRLRGGK
jgi:putative peptidoglycan lipid II flippase